MEVRIRKAVVDDLDEVHNLVRALAIYEKAEPEFVASIKSYQENFKEGVFDVLVAELEGQIIGMMLYYLTFSTWKGRMLYLEDFVVLENYRGKGVGQRLFEALKKEAKELGCILAKWQVLDWNTPAVRFYEKNDAIIEKEWWNCKLFFEERD